MSNEISLRVGEMVAVKGPFHIKSLGIGSCVVIVIYDKKNQVTAMAHCMLPEAFDENEKGRDGERVEEGVRIHEAKYISSALPKMLDLALKLGADKQSLKVKLVGGAAMFKSFIVDSISVGSKNVETTKRILNSLGLSVSAENTGGNQGRSVSFNTANGVLNVNTRI